MIEIGSVVVVLPRRETAVVTGFDNEDYAICETLDDGVCLGAYPLDELEELQ